MHENKKKNVSKKLSSRVHLKFLAHNSCHKNGGQCNLKAPEKKKEKINKSKM